MKVSRPPSEKLLLRLSLRIAAAAAAVVALLVGSCAKHDAADETEPPSSAAPATEPLPVPAETSNTTQPPDPDRDNELASVPGVTQQDFQGQMAPVMAKTDQIDQEWNTEVFSLAVNDKLEEVAKWIEAGAIDGKSLELISLKTVSSTPLRHQPLTTVFEDSLTQVNRWEPSSTDAPEFIVGREALTHHLSGLLTPLQSTTERHAKFKTYRVEPSADRVATTAQYQASGRQGKGTVEQTATLNFEWTVERQPRLVKLTIDRYEEIIPSSSGGLRFIDRGPQAFAQEQTYAQQLTQGADFWRKRLQADFGIDVNGLQGVALGDVDGDGLEDLYVCQHGGLPNKMFLRNADGTLRDISAASGTDWMELTRAAVFVDLDNDGDQDLAMTQGWYWVLMENNGSGTFSKRAETRGNAWYYSIAAADYDNDGKLDLYICGRNPSAEQRQLEGFLGTPIPFHDANNGGPNILLKNDGNWNFSDVTVKSGMDVNNRRYSYAAVWEDYDNDGDQDLYVANDFGRNCLYRNDKGRFSEIAAKAGVEDISAGMGVTWADFDHDGDMDLHVSNMFSSAGNRIAYQRNFRASAGDSRSAYRRHARGNSLFANNGKDSFSDVSDQAGITLGRWAWGARFADFNNDGWEDLYVANGFITTEDTGDL
ncbi:MAG: VCBS repeat-containing protein [Verrucomicrobia bacterium]|nr:VCBS repeat-containing protein [Verrucomicrobiota bacterium]